MGWIALALAVVGVMGCGDDSETAEASSAVNSRSVMDAMVGDGGADAETGVMGGAATTEGQP